MLSDGPIAAVQVKKVFNMTMRPGGKHFQALSFHWPSDLSQDLC